MIDFSRASDPAELAASGWRDVTRESGHLELEAESRTFGFSGCSHVLLSPGAAKKKRDAEALRDLLVACWYACYRLGSPGGQRSHHQDPYPVDAIGLPPEPSWVVAIRPDKASQPFVAIQLPSEPALWAPEVES